MPLNLDSTASTTDRSATSSVHGLLPQLRKLIDTAENARQTVLNEADSLIKKLKEAHRALSVIAHLDDRYVIAVTGPQGTGKTTMMKSLYGIPDEYLKVNPGVGEKLPILIVEHSEDRFDADVHRYRGGGVQRQSIEAPECRKVASSPGIDDVMVELRVPERFFGSEDRGFLLLPGSEKISTSYTELVDHVLPCASTAVVCVDDTSMAQEHTRQEIERLRADLEGAKELYALTKANQSNDSNEELRETVVDTFNLPREKERTVAIGNISRQEDPSWVSDLREAIDRHAAIPRAHQEAQAREIKDILFDVRDAVSDINRKIQAAQASEGQEVKNILSEFEDQVERQREALAEKLERTLQAYRSRATEKVANEITENESLLEKVKPAIFTETLSDRINFKNLINREWRNAGKYGPGVAVAQTLNDVSQEHLPRRKPLSGPEIEDEGDRPRLASRNENPTELIGSFDPQAKEDGAHSLQVPIAEETVEDVRIFMGVESPDKFNDPKLSIRAVPALALEATRFGFVGHLSLDETETVEAGLEDIVDEIEAVRGTSRRFLSGVGTMLGLDALPDAEIDVVKELLTAAGVGEEAAAGIAGPAAVALLGAYSTVSVMNTVAQRDIQRADAADAALEKVVDRTKQRVLSIYDRSMKTLRRRVEDRLRKEAGLNQAFTDRINLKKAGNDVDKRIRKVHEQLPSSV